MVSDYDFSYGLDFDEREQETPPGVIFVLKNRNNDINIDHKNRLHPFYMVYTMSKSVHNIN